jgi:RND family efflux transporter MFP subunit
MKLHMRFAMPLLLAACASHEPPPTSEPAKTTQVTTMPESHTIDCVAVITSSESEAIAAKSDGAVMTVKVHDGQFVRKDELIAQIDTQELRNTLEKAQGERARAAGDAGRAGAEASNAARKAALARRMANAGVSSQADYQNAMAEAASAGAGGAGAVGAMRSAEATIKEQEILIAAADLKSPMDGIISNIKFHEGEVPHKGVTIARVFNPAKLQVRFLLPRAKRAVVKEHDHIEIDYGTDRKVGASVSEVRDTHDVAIDFLTVIAELDNAPRAEDLQVGVRGLVHLADKGVAQ